MYAFELMLLGAALCLGGAGVLLWVSRQRRQREERLLRTRLGGSAIDGSALVVGSDRFSGPFGPLWKAICYRFWAAGIDLGLSAARRMVLGITAVGIVLVLFFGPLPAIILVGATVAAIGLYVTRERARRHNLLVELLPRGFEYLARALVAGNSMETALAKAGRELPEPLRGLLRSVARQVELGASLAEVLHETADIHRLDDLHLLALATFVNRRYGGDLSQILRDLAAVIRDRERAEAELRAATGETRVSAWVLVLIPVGLVIYVLLQNPGYYTDMWARPVGRGLLLASGVLQALGAAVIWHMLQGAGEE